jgi:tetratricopeptide (TPR) repeat protein
MIMKMAIAILASLMMFAPSGSVKAESATTGQTQVDGIFDKMIDQLWAQTDVAWHRGDYPGVVALNRIIVGIDPHFVQAYGNGVYVMESMGLISDAEAFGQQSVRNNPNQSQSYSDLGMCYFSFAHDYPAAEVTFRQAVTLCPDVSILEWKMLAHSIEKEGLIDDAVATWQEIKRRYPNGLAVDRNLNGDLARQKAMHAQNQPVDSK